MTLLKRIRPARVALVLLIPLMSGCKEDAWQPAAFDPARKTAKIEAAVVESPLTQKAQRIADAQSKTNRDDEKQANSVETP